MGFVSWKCSIVIPQVHLSCGVYIHATFEVSWYRLTTGWRRHWSVVDCQWKRHSGLLCGHLLPFQEGKPHLVQGSVPSMRKQLL